VSRLWRDQIRVFFAPGRVDLVRSCRGMKPRQVARLTTVCESAADLPAWEAPLEKLDQMIADAAGTEIAITISNHFVRYTVIPPQTKISNPAELNAYAAFHMREVYGERAAAWVLGVSSWDPCSGAICAALDRALLERLEELTGRRKVRLQSIEPYLTAAFDRWCKRFEGERMWFALVETGRICLASLSSGVWQRVGNQRMLASAGEELLAMLDQEALLFSGRKEAVEHVHLFAPEHPNLTLPDGCGWKVIPLQSGGMPVPAHFPSSAMVASGAEACAA